MPFPFFPYFIAPAPEAPSTTTTVVPPLWGTPWTIASTQWLSDADPLPFPRIERVYDQVPNVADEVEFAHRIKSEFPFVIGTGNQIIIRSVITSP